jgi:hypothetical protein
MKEKVIPWISGFRGTQALARRVHDGLWISRAESGWMGTRPLLEALNLDFFWGLAVEPLTPPPRPGALPAAFKKVLQERLSPTRPRA